MPAAHVRLSAGREEMSDELQALCFMAGANSIFYGEKLLTTGNPDVERDRHAVRAPGLAPEAAAATRRRCGGTRTLRACDSRRALSPCGRGQQARRALTATSLSQLEAAQLRRRRLTVESFASPGIACGCRSAAASSSTSAATTTWGWRAIRPWRRRWPSARAAPAPAAPPRTWSAATGASTSNWRRNWPRSPRRERALLFTSGYAANLAVMTSLAGRGERAVLDRLCHASLIDGARLSGATLKRYAHADAMAAQQMLGAARRTAALLATDGVFSMDGDLAPLPQLAAARPRPPRPGWSWTTRMAWACIGASGGGTLEHFGLDARAAPVLVGTLGKAFGSFGAFVAGDAALVEFLIQKARSYIYTTALPQPVAAASRAALALVLREGWRRERVRELTLRFRERARRWRCAACGFGDPDPAGAAGQRRRSRGRAGQLAAAGFLVIAIRPPTVPAGSARLRVTLSAAHTEAQVDALVEALALCCARARAAHA